MSEQSVLPGMAIEQQLAYARDLRRIYEVEREKRRELEAANQALAAANAEIAQRAEALQRAEQQLVAYARDVRRAYEAERDRREELHAAYMTTVRLLAAAIETRDPYTGGHVDRVAELSVATGRELGWDEEQLQKLELGALLHDVGKIGVEDRILRKPGRLDPDELAQMREHPVVGARLLADVPFLQPGMTCALRHHEQYDGRGYPEGLAGEDIPVEARVVAVADTFDAMTSDRPYRKGLAVDTALDEIARCAGTQFDPAIADAFVRTVRAGAVVAMSNA
jgi:HD-GYP domain-containing protein (c-di-GMP phosphodiesterase class II)